MSELIHQLENIADGDTTTIYGIDVTPREGKFIINGKAYAPKNAIKILQYPNNFEYENLVFALVRPPSDIISTRTIENRGQHLEMMQEAKDRGMYVYYTSIVGNGNSAPKQPWILDWSSLYNDHLDGFDDNTIEEEKQAEQSDSQSDSQDDGGLVCPFCDKKMSSTPGRTLHVKAQHPDKIEEYKEMVE